MQMNDILQRLTGVKRASGDEHYLALCPCHNDHKPSLDVKAGKVGIVMNCPVCGADGRAVAAALGITVRDLFYEQRKPQRQAPEGADYFYTDSLKKSRYYFWSDKKQGWDKGFCWYHKDGESWKKGMPCGENGDKIKPPLYRQANIAAAVNAGEPLYIAEGEKDVDTLTDKLGLFAVCSPHGAGSGRLENKWDHAYNALFKGADVAILADNDEAGKALSEHIAAEILPFAKSVKLPDLSFEWEDLKPKGDITDVYESTSPMTGKTVAETVNMKLNALVVITEKLKPKADLKPQKYIRLSDIESTETEWLWYPYIPLGKITLMTADPGTGKTFLALYLTAQVSTGRPFYGESVYREPAVAVYQTAEDGVADTIKPRLEPMRPNFENILVFNEEKESLSLSSEHIEEIMKELSPKLMIFDPLQAYLGAGVDMHRANEVRPVLGRIAHLAEKYKCAVIFIMHNSKSAQNSALLRSLGSVDIPAVARSMLVLANNPDKQGGKIMCHEKSSLAAHGRSVLFEIAPQYGGIAFEGFSDLKADDVISSHREGRKKSSAKLDEVCDSLLELFDKNGRLEVSSIKDLCDSLGCSHATLYRAKKELQIENDSSGFGKDKRIVWTLPETDIDTSHNSF